ncbi:MAG: hypothetical protein RL186_731 [Pseudomonadota bacterium]
MPHLPHISSKRFARSALALALLCAGFATTAQADVADQTIAADSNPEMLYERIVTTASSMCLDAARVGEVVDVGQCVEIVVARTVAELNQADLTAIALNQSPTLIAAR